MTQKGITLKAITQEGITQNGITLKGITQEGITKKGMKAGKARLQHFSTPGFYGAQFSATKDVILYFLRQKNHRNLKIASATSF